MKIIRTKPNKHGWRLKFVYRKNMDISITHEHNHSGYWKESKLSGHSTFIDYRDIPILLNFLKQINREL